MQCARSAPGIRRPAGSWGPMRARLQRDGGEPATVGAGRRFGGDVWGPLEGRVLEKAAETMQAVSTRCSFNHPRPKQPPSRTIKDVCPDLTAVVGQAVESLAVDADAVGCA